MSSGAVSPKSQPDPVTKVTPRTKDPGPCFSLLLVCHNSHTLLPRCLEAMETGLRASSSSAQVELVAIDNAYSDGSVDLLKEHWPGQLLLPGKNLGFGGALNLGIAHTKAPWIIGINPDILLAPDFFRQLAIDVAALEDSPGIGMLAPKLLHITLECFLTGSPPEQKILDSTGLFLDRRRQPYDRGQGEPDSRQFDTSLEVLGPCGACAIYRRSMLEKLAIGGEIFDERLFLYYEDVDLAWRGRRSGFRAIHVPKVLAWHIRQGADSVRRSARIPGHRKIAARALANRYLVLLKNESPGHFLRALPAILFWDTIRLGYTLFRTPGLFVQAMEHLILDARATWKKRHASRGETGVDPFLRNSPRSRTAPEKRGRPRQ